MSVEASTWAWRQAVKGNAKLVLLAIADHADPVGVCWPGQEGLAKKCGITDRSVRDQLSSLESDGLLVRTPRWREGGGRSSDLITLSMRAENGSGMAQGIPENLVSATGANRNHASAINRNHASGEPPVEPPVDEPSSSGVAEVLRLLSELANARGLVPPSFDAISRALADFPDRDHLEVARDFDYWARHGNGADRKRMAIANTYRNFLKRAEPKPSTTTSSSERSRWSAWMSKHCPEFDGYTFEMAVTHAVNLADRGDTPTAEAIHHYVEQRTRGSEG